MVKKFENLRILQIQEKRQITSKRVKLCQHCIKLHQIV